MARQIKNPQTGEVMQEINGEWKPVPPPKMAERVQKTIKGDAEAVRKPNDVDRFKTMVSNFPSSAAKLGSDLYSAISSPLDTAGMIGKTALGGAQMLIPGQQSYEPYAEAVGQHYSDKYGSLDQLKETMIQDPVGVLGDAAGLMTGGAMAIPKTGASVARVGSMLDPVNMATRGLSAGAMNLPGMRSAPGGLYKSAAKLPKKFDQDAVTQTALREGIMPTDAGITKGRGLLSATGDQIDNIINDSVMSGQKINRKALYQHVDDVRADMGGVNLDATKNLKKIDGIVDDFETHMDSIGKQNVTAAEAQKFKQDIYKSINWKAKQGTGSQAGANTRKAIARGAKDEIEKLIPEIKNLNLRQGDIIELLDAIDAPAARIANRDMIGLGMPAKIITGSLVGDTSGAVAGFLLGLADSPTLKANLSLGLNNIKNLDIGAAQKRVAAIELLRTAGSLNEIQTQNQ